MNVDHQRLLAAIEALEGEGYSVVPTKADADVIDAGVSANAHGAPFGTMPGYDSTFETVRSIWDAMIAKAADGLKAGVKDEPSVN